MIVIIFCLNLIISWANAWGCGATWDATKAKGGLAHFLNWMGATMAACGFTWCYLVIVGLLGTIIPLTNEETGITAPLLDPATLQAFFDLGFLVIVPPILGSGLVITVASWRQVARSRSTGDGLIAGWNTFAQVHNTYTVISETPKLLSRLGDFFGESSKDKIVILLVGIAVAGGLLTTYGIIQWKRRDVAAEQVLA